MNGVVQVMTAELALLWKTSTCDLQINTLKHIHPCMCVSTLSVLASNVLTQSQHIVYAHLRQKAHVSWSTDSQSTPTESRTLTPGTVRGPGRPIRAPAGHDLLCEDLSTISVPLNNVANAPQTD